ncbi:ASCH domain-containing protein [Spirosoma sp. HMF4905]|uniref:ASCH domain-containing protein n=1 Tax=Spirosoma arboris TaxID=2682092 RepID=A0A7K1SMN6_9BACT|nr:ASCH domain-containing protein [Spirosoma arboris]MVM35059.1 ASCH domain-containing protein [Spirosoma arboris]
MDDTKPWWHELNQFSFGDSAEMADELAALVVQGIKTGTSWLVSEGQQTFVGQQHVVLNGAGRPVAVIETTELRQLPYNEVDAAFAYDSGEEDRSLANWRLGYQRFYERQGKFAIDMLMYCERFKLIDVIN